MGCIWRNRQVSDWVVVLHSFEEYLHSPDLVALNGSFSIQEALRTWTSDTPNVAWYHLSQEPIGGGGAVQRRSVLSAWTHSSGETDEEAATGAAAMPNSTSDAQLVAQRL